MYHKQKSMHGEQRSARYIERLVILRTRTWLASSKDGGHDEWKVQICIESQVSSVVNHYDLVVQAQATYLQQRLHLCIELGRP